METYTYTDQGGKREHNKRSFSLIEIVIVIAIIGGLMAIIIPRVNSYRLKS